MFVAARRSVSAALLVIAVSFLMALAFAASRAGAVGVGIILCGSQSNITVMQPESDNVVTSPDLVIKGLVNQAAQIEVMLDDAFDGVVPLNLGQTTFETTVRLRPGTHTIKLKAINACDTGEDDTVSLVVTYSPPPERNADGEVAINPVGEDGAGGAPVDGMQAGGIAGLLEPLRAGTDGVLRIFDIRPLDGQYEGSRLSIGRAVMLAASLFLVVFGPFFARFVTFVSRLPVVRSLGKTSVKRARVAKWTIRLLGVLLFVATLLV